MVGSSLYPKGELYVYGKSLIENSEKVLYIRKDNYMHLGKRLIYNWHSEVCAA